MHFYCTGNNVYLMHDVYLSYCPSLPPYMHLLLLPTCTCMQVRFHAIEMGTQLYSLGATDATGVVRSVHYSPGE